MTAPATASDSAPRVGVVGLFGECNAFREPLPFPEYPWMAYHEGDALLEALADPAAFLLPETRAFFAAMDASGGWRPVPLVYAAAASGPPVHERLLDQVFDRLQDALRAAGPLDAVYVSGHGSLIGTTTKDTDARLLAMLRAHLGPDAPIVETLDPHGKVTPAMIDGADVLVSYRTDPHVDMAERGTEAAHHLRSLLSGRRPYVAYVRLPIMVPTVSMVAAAAPFRPAIELGERRRDASIANVSILPGYPWTDRPFAGLHVLVTGWQRGPAEALARELAQFVWDRRSGFRVQMLDCDGFVARAKAVAENRTLMPVCFADVADNPGGGARGNTVHALQALVAAGVRDCVVGVLHDPAVAAQAHAAGVGAEIQVRFNENVDDPFSKPFAARARVTALADGRFTARAGVGRGVPLDQGPTAALAIGAVTVVVNSRCLQTLAVEQLEMVGVDPGRVRSVVVKSRGHYQGSFGEFFTREQMIEIDLPGWVTPHLETLPFRHIPRPLFPLDDDVRWGGELTYLKVPVGAAT